MKTLEDARDALRALWDETLKDNKDVARVYKVKKEFIAFMNAEFGIRRVSELEDYDKFVARCEEKLAVLRTSQDAGPTQCGTSEAGPRGT